MKLRFFIIFVTTVLFTVYTNSQNVRGIDKETVEVLKIERIETKEHSVEYGYKILLRNSKTREKMLLVSFGQ